jgi:DNA-binding protein H-NS
MRNQRVSTAIAQHYNLLQVEEVIDVLCARLHHSLHTRQMIEIIDLNALLAQKEALEKQIEDAQNEQKTAAIAKIRELMATGGITLRDINDALIATRVSARRAKVPAKYRNQETGDAWSGRGRKPNWLVIQLDRGRKIEEFAA